MIASTAFIHSSAQVDETVVIEHNAYVGEGCIIHKNVKIGVNAVVEAHTEIGESTIISPNAHVGGHPQDISYKNEDTKLKIGKNCVIREFATINRASTKEDWITEVGDNCYLMAYAHIAHDCKVGNEVIIANYSPLAGHVHVEDYVTISGLTGIHQFVHVGTMAMISGLTRIVKDVPPYTTVEGNPATIHGLNSVGLRRRGLNPQTRSELKKILNIFNDKSLLLKDAIEKIGKEASSKEAKHFIEFITSSKRGVIRR
jgi:UDP-N-acetylglucosamine acyltransferase